MQDQEQYHYKILMDGDIPKYARPTEITDLFSVHNLGGKTCKFGCRHMFLTFVTQTMASAENFLFLHIHHGTMTTTMQLQMYNHNRCSLHRICHQDFTTLACRQVSF